MLKQLKKEYKKKKVEVDKGKYIREISNEKKKIIDSFILFGCWNNVDCTSKNWRETPIYRDIVIENIKKEIEKLIIVAGDNWYSQNYDDRENTYKYYPFTTLTSGYKLLLNTEKDIDIIMGNHDENNDTIKSKNPNLKKDCMLKTQKYVIEKIVNNERIKIPTLEELENVNTENKMLNGKNIYTCIKKSVIKELNIGVYVIYINTNLFDNYTYKASNTDRNKITTKKMLSYINNIKNELSVHKPKLLFVVGHNPLIAYKKKKYHKLNNIYDDNEGGGAYIMELLIEELNKYKTLYLCADVHNFSIALLKKNIGTVIAGTGGGVPDIEKIEGKIDNKKILKSPKNKESKNIFNIRDHYIYNAYGYVKIKYDKDYNVYVTYRQLFNANKEKGYDNKIIRKKIIDYKFKFKNRNNGWELIKINNIDEINKINLDMSKQIKEKKRMCNIIKSNKKNNITELIKLNQLVKSNTVKYNYLKTDKNTPLLCYYKKKRKLDKIK